MAKKKVKSSHLSRHLALSVFISLFLIVAFGAINANVTGSAVLVPTQSSSTNIVLSFIVPFLFFTALFLLIFSYIERNA